MTDEFKQLWRSQPYLDTCGELCESMDPIQMVNYLPCLQPADKDCIRARNDSFGGFKGNNELLSRMRAYGERGFKELGQALQKTGHEDLSRKIGYQGSDPAASNAVPQETSDPPPPLPGPPEPEPPLRTRTSGHQMSSGGGGTVNMNLTFNANVISNPENVQCGDGGKMDVTHTVPNSNAEPGYDVVSEADSAERPDTNDRRVNGVNNSTDDDDDDDDDGENNNHQGGNEESSPSTPQRATQRDPVNASVLPSGASRVVPYNEVNATGIAHDREVTPLRETVRPNANNMNDHVIEESTGSEDEEKKKCDTDDEEEEEEAEEEEDEEEGKKLNTTMETELRTNSIEDNKSLNASLPSPKTQEGVPNLPIFVERLNGEEEEDEEEEETCLLKFSKQNAADSASDIEEDGYEFSLESSPETKLNEELPSFVPASHDRGPVTDRPPAENSSFVPASHDRGPVTDRPPAENSRFFNSVKVKYMLVFTLGILATVLFQKIVKR